MFIEKEDLYTIVSRRQLDGITKAEADIRWAIEAAVREAESYLDIRYDTQSIFSAQGNDRHATLLEYCKSLALWYLVRKCNTDIIFSHVADYRAAAIDWLEKVSGLSDSSVVLQPNLPLKQTQTP